VFPTTLPEGTRLSRCSVAPPEAPDRLDLDYVVDPGQRYSFSISEGPALGPADSPRGPERERLTVDGVQLGVHEWGDERFHSIDVVLRRHGVPVRIRSDLDRELVIAIAVSLEPI